MGEGLIAVVHDRPKERASIREVLETEGFQVVAGADVETSLQYLREHPPTAAIVANSRKMDGLSVCFRVRSDSRLRTLPLIILNEGGEKSRMAALEAGADEAMNRPLKARELLLRLRAMLRRSGPRILRDDVLQAGDLLIDESRAKATFGGKTATLSVAEMRILKVFAAHPDRILQREELLRITGKRADRSIRCIDTHMVAIRRKLGPDLIETVPKRGYRLRDRGLPLGRAAPAASPGVPSTT